MPSTKRVRTKTGVSIFPKGGRSCFMHVYFINKQIDTYIHIYIYTYTELGLRKKFTNTSRSVNWCN